jgi:hypothetical protein
VYTVYGYDDCIHNMGLHACLDTILSGLDMYIRFIYIRVHILE